MRTPQNIEDGFAPILSRDSRARTIITSRFAWQSSNGRECRFTYEALSVATAVATLKIVGTGRWPDQISAPTGAGKTSVIDIHVYLNALAGESQGNPEYDSDLTRRLNAVPRRLALLAPRRGLVDDQSDISTMIQEKVHTGVSPVMTRVREGLLTRAGAAVLGETTAPLLAFVTPCEVE